VSDEHATGSSAVANARVFGIDRKTVAKNLKHSVPPCYRRTRPPTRPKLDPFGGALQTLAEFCTAVATPARPPQSRRRRYCRPFGPQWAMGNGQWAMVS